MKMNNMKRETQIAPLEALRGLSDRVADITKDGLSEDRGRTLQFSATIVSIVVGTKTIEIMTGVQIPVDTLVLFKNNITARILCVVENIQSVVESWKIQLNVIKYPWDDLSLFKIGQVVDGEVFKLSKGSAALSAQLEIVYADKRRSDGETDIHGGSSDVEDYVDDLNEALIGEIILDVTEVAAAIDDARFRIAEAEYCAGIPGFESKTCIIPFIDAEVLGRRDAQPVLDTRDSDPCTQPMCFGTGFPEFMVDLLAERDLIGLDIFSHNGTIGDFDQNPERALANIIEDLDWAFETRQQFGEQIAEIKSEEESDKLLVKLEEMQKGGDLPKYLARCCVKMVDPVTGDMWPAYEVYGVRKIRKRPTIRGSNVKGKGKCKCEKYYRLMCSKGGDSTRTGVFQGRMQLEFQYMDMVDVCRHIRGYLY
jgi:hypothetical protein